MKGNLFSHKATNACDRTLKGACIRVELLLLRSFGSSVLFAKMNSRLIEVVRAHAGNYPRLYGLRTNLTRLTASVLCRFGARCRYRSRRQKRSLAITDLCVIELIATKVGKEGIEVIRSLFVTQQAQDAKSDPHPTTNNRENRGVH
jgi:hypothetical protein